MTVVYIRHAVDISNITKSILAPIFRYQNHYYNNVCLIYRKVCPFLSALYRSVTLLFHSLGSLHKYEAQLK